jgi:SPP1 gp7 family putative phage head morphogenesis protein
MTIRDAFRGFVSGLKIPVRSGETVPVVGGSNGLTVPVIDSMHRNPTTRNIPRAWNNAYMGPGSPLGAMMDNARTQDRDSEPRAFQYLTNVNATISPRLAYGLTPFTELRDLAESVPEISMCLRIIIEELKSFDPSITGPDGKETKNPDLNWMIEKPDRFNPFPVWVSRFLYNVLVYDAGAIYRNRVGTKITSMRVVDGSTLFVMIDERGEQPAPPAPAFAQIIYGTPLNYYNTHQLWYRPRHLRADAPYGRSPIEDSLPAVRLLQNIWAYEGSWYTEGSTAEQVLTAPPNWTPEQILDFEMTYNDRMAGNTVERAGRIRFVPNGTNSLSLKDARFRQDVYEAAANTVRMTYGIPRTEFGESPASGLGGSGFLDAMQDVFYRMCLAPMKAYIESAFNDTLTENGYEGYKFELAFPKESMDTAKEEEKVIKRFTSGLITRDEGRKGIGEKPLGGELGEYMVDPGQGQPGAGEGESMATGPMFQDPEGNFHPGTKMPVKNGKIPVAGKKIPVKGAKIAVTDKVPTTGDMVPVSDDTEPVKVEKLDEPEKDAEPGEAEATGKEDPFYQPDPNEDMPAGSMRKSNVDARHRRAKTNVRRKLEKTITASALAELSWMWDQLQDHLKELEGQKPKPGAEKMEKLDLVESHALWDIFQQRMQARVSTALSSGLLTLVSLELAHQHDLGQPLNISPADLVANYQAHIGEMITKVAQDTKDFVAQKVAAWYNTPETTLGDLVDQLKPQFGEGRARLIATNETTNLNSNVVRETMLATGLDTWKWITNRDEVVCPVCGALQGKIFHVQDPMPPAGSHIGCRCDVAPVRNTNQV